MLAKGKNSVNGKCVLVCTMVEILWHKFAHQPEGMECVSNLTLCKTKNKQGLIMLQVSSRSCIQIAVQLGTKTGVPMASRENFALHMKAAMAPIYDERRRFQRISLQVPLFIRGRDAYGEQFVDLGKTLDISALGALVASPRPLAINDVVTLTIPAPSITSSALVPSGMPPIQARVKRQQEAGDVHLVGLEFLKPIG